MLPKLKHANVKSEFYNIWRVENLNYITHIHEELEMVYLSQGQLEVTLEDEAYLLRAGGCLLCRQPAGPSVPQPGLQQNAS